jgi:hypothetical protein
VQRQILVNPSELVSVHMAICLLHCTHQNTADVNISRFALVIGVGHECSLTIGAQVNMQCPRSGWRKRECVWVCAPFSACPAYDESGFPTHPLLRQIRNERTRCSCWPSSASVCSPKDPTSPISRQRGLRYRPRSGARDRIRKGVQSASGELASASCEGCSIERLTAGVVD